MGAPKGNDYWKKRTKHGRDATFGNAVLMAQAFIEYVQLMQESPMYTIEQTTGKQKPVYDELTDQWVISEPLTYIPEKRPLTLIGFCRYLGCSENYFRTTRAASKDKDLLLVIDDLVATIYSDQQEGALRGHYNANLTARLQGIAEVTKSEISGPNGGPVQVSTPVDDKEYERLYMLKYGTKPPDLTAE